MLGGAYLTKNMGKNECPSGSVLINTETGCKAVKKALTADNVLKHVGSWSSVPKGCGHNADGDWFFNTHSSGGARDVDSPICFAPGQGGATSVGCRVAHR